MGNVSTFRRQTFRCDPCDTQVVAWRWGTDPAPRCVGCGALMAVAARRFGESPAVIGDACDVTVEHGICWPDGTPRRYTSKVEMKRVADSLGLVLDVQHKPLPGSDKSPFTVRWT